MHKTIDKRVERTQRYLFDSLLYFKKQNVNYESISIRNLSDKAGIARQTFYRNYLTKDAVILSKLNQLMEDFKENLKRNELTAANFVSLLIKYWNNERSLFELIEWARIDRAVIDRLTGLNRDIIAQNNIENEYTEFISNYYAGATYMFLKTYVDQNKKSAEQAASLYGKLTNQCHDLFIGLD
ncbi:TetR/AcrR family transcriptional regulator [Sporolactobacillus pectinivorans]|uniref:TetR/AcrR family transcriptional regulator n=1 Tax=Sporolactobacillus pectinivorans TaxID=1591408 RepID=UPI000C2626A9|nr:TetR/AcrR family transcriptional regulator [Sporolactobacillus pectinivorans]